MAGKDKGSALERELAELRAQVGSLAADNKRLQSLTMQFFTTPPAATVPPADNMPNDKLPVEVNLDGLPDPVAEPKEYQKQLAKRMKQSIRSGVEAGLARMPKGAVVDPAAERRNAFYNDVWESFKAEHPELAKFEGELSAVVAGEVSKIAAQGIDVDRYLMADPEGFKNSVAAQATAHLEALGVDLTVKEPKDEPAVKDGQPANTLGMRREEDTYEEPDNSASLEIFGARPSAERGAQGDKGAVKQSNLTDELKAVQQHMGLVGNRVAH